MKTWKWSNVVGLLALLLLPTLLWVGVAQAQSFRTGNATTVAADEVVDSALYAAGQSVDIAGQVNGDVFCAGQTVTISGKVNGDVICAGQTVTISGTVMGDVRVAGQTVTVSAIIDGNLSAGSQSFSLTQQAKVGQDAAVGGDDMTVNGNIGRDLAAGGTTVVLGGAVGRNVTADTNDLTLRDKASVKGNLTYAGVNEASVASDTQVAGSTTWNQRAEKESQGNYGQLFAFSLGMAIFVILALLITSLVAVLLFPAVFHQATKRASAAPLKTFLTGLLANIAAPIVIVAVMMTLVGLPLGGLMLLAWLLILGLSGPFFAYFLGTLILKKQTNPILIMLVGSLIVAIAYFIPIIGFIALVVVMWFGAGIILRELFHRTPKPTYDLKDNR